MNRLTTAKVRSLTNPGRYSDGEGTYLNVSMRGSKSWVQRISIDGIRRDISLGEYPTVSLAEAGDLARRNKSDVASGVNPIAEKRRAVTPTFRKAALQVHRINLPTWRNRKYAAQWISTLETHVFPTTGDMKVDAIRKRDVLACLTPIWTEKPETARRVRQRMRSVFSWANGTRLC